MVRSCHACVNLSRLRSSGFTPMMRSGSYPSPTRQRAGISLASSPARAKTEKRLVHTVCACVYSPQDWDSGLFSDSSMLCDVRVRTRYSILVRIIQWRVMKVRIAAQLLTLNFVRLIIAVSKLSTLCLHARRDSVSRRHRSTLYPTELLSLRLSWLAFFLPNNATL